jgi:hypothetical protein
MKAWDKDMKRNDTKNSSCNYLLFFYKKNNKNDKKPCRTPLQKP